jgi:branched-chain amino acid transport system substrate-binding protein
MKRTIQRYRWAAVGISAVLLAAACGEGRDDGGTGTGAGGDGAAASPGITDDTVKLGSSYPQSGPASAYGVIGQAVTACFDRVNAEGGIEMGDGQTREVEFIIYDDAYAPDRAVQNTRRLVEQDEVFAVFNPLGTPNNEAIRPYLNDNEVPHIYLATGASTWGAEVEQYPWTIGWQPSYPTESAIYGQFLQDEFPDGATVAVLYQNDDYGEDYLGGFEAAIEGTDIEIIARESYEVADPSVDSQMVNLAQSGADVFFNITTPKFAAQALAAEGRSDWDPLHLLNSVSASISAVLEPAGLENAEGVYTAQYLKEPSDPAWEDDEAMQDYREAGEQYGNFNLDDPFGVFGFAVCGTMVEALSQMEEPTRESLMESVRNMEYEEPLLLPGIRVATNGEDDTFPIEAMQLVRFEGGEWETVGDVVDFEGETPVPD